MKTPEQIEGLSKKLSDATAELNKIRDEIKDRVSQIETDYKEPFEAASEKAAQAEEELSKAIEESKELYIKPKTQTYFNVKAGLSKKQDKFEISDKEKSIKLIKEKMPALVPALIHIEESIVVEPLKNFETDELKSLGIEFVKGKEEVTISIVKEKSKVSDEIDKAMEKSPLKQAV